MFLRLLALLANSPSIVVLRKSKTQKADGEEYASSNNKPYWHNNIAKNQFIFRALSCPYKISAVATSLEHERTCMDAYPCKVFIVVVSYY